MDGRSSMHHRRRLVLHQRCRLVFDNRRRRILDDRSGRILYHRSGRVLEHRLRMGDVHLAEGGITGGRSHMLDSVHKGRRMDDRRGGIVNDRSGFHDLWAIGPISNRFYGTRLTCPVICRNRSYRGRMSIILVFAVSGRCRGGGDNGHQQCKDDLKTGTVDKLLWTCECMYVSRTSFANRVRPPYMGDYVEFINV